MISKPLALIGMMGAGKSTVARLVAERLGCLWFDLDRIVEEQAGQPVPAIFQVQGEAAFRAMEKEALTVLAHETASPYVVATGGGVPVDSANRAILKSVFQVVWLDAKGRQLYRRACGPDRPLTRGGLARFLALAEEREPIYRELGELRIDVSRRSPERVAAMTLDWWKEQGEAGDHGI